MLDEVSLVLEKNEVRQAANNLLFLHFVPLNLPADLVTSHVLAAPFGHPVDLLPCIRKVHSQLATRDEVVTETNLRRSSRPQESIEGPNGELGEVDEWGAKVSEPVERMVNGLTVDLLLANH